MKNHLSKNYNIGYWTSIKDFLKTKAKSIQLHLIHINLIKSSIWVESNFKEISNQETLYLLQKGFLKLRNKKKAPKSLQAPRLESLTCTQFLRRFSTHQ